MLTHDPNFIRGCTQESRAVYHRNLMLTHDPNFIRGCMDPDLIQREWDGILARGKTRVYKGKRIFIRDREFKVANLILNGHSNGTVGKTIGVSQVRVLQIFKKVMRQLAHPNQQDAAMKKNSAWHLWMHVRSACKHKNFWLPRLRYWAESAPRAGD